MRRILVGADAPGSDGGLARPSVAAGLRAASEGFGGGRGRGEEGRGGREKQHERSHPSQAPMRIRLALRAAFQALGGAARGTPAHHDRIVPMEYRAATPVELAGHEQKARNAFIKVCGAATAHSRHPRHPATGDLPGYPTRRPTTPPIYQPITRDLLTNCDLSFKTIPSASPAGLRRGGGGGPTRQGEPRLPASLGERCSCCRVCSAVPPGAPGDPVPTSGQPHSRRRTHDARCPLGQPHSLTPAVRRPVSYLLT